MTGDGRADVLLGMLVSADPSAAYDVLVFAQQADGSLAYSGTCSFKVY